MAEDDISGGHHYMVGQLDIQELGSKGEHTLMNITFLGGFLSDGPRGELREPPQGSSTELLTGARPGLAALKLQFQFSQRRQPSCVELGTFGSTFREAAIFRPCRKGAEKVQTVPSKCWPLRSWAIKGRGLGFELLQSSCWEVRIFRGLRYQFRVAPKQGRHEPSRTCIAPLVSLVLLKRSVPVIPVQGPSLRASRTIATMQTQNEYIFPVIKGAQKAYEQH